PPRHLGGAEARMDAHAGEVSAEEGLRLRERGDVEPARLVEERAEPDLLGRELAVSPIALLRRLEEAHQRAEPCVPGLAEDAGRGVGAVLHLVRDVLSFAHPAIGLLQPAVDSPRLLVYAAGGSADLAGVTGEGVEPHSFQERLGLPRDALHLASRALEPREPVHADLGVVHALAEQRRALLRPAGDPLGESFQAVEYPGEEAASLRTRPALLLGRVIAAPVPPGVDDGCAFRGNESAEDLGKEHHPFARADPRVQRGRVDVLEVDDPDVAARRPAVGMDPSVLAVEDAVDQITDRVVVLLSARGGPARLRAIALRFGLAGHPGVEVEALQPANELEQVRADLQVVLARARRLFRQLGIVRSGLHRPRHLEPGLLAHRAQRLHPVTRFLRAPGVHQPLDLLDRRADLLAEGGDPVERVLDGLLRARLRRRPAMVAAGGSLARIPAAVDGEVGFAAGVPIPVRRSLPVNLLEMSCVMSLGRLKPQMKDLVALVQELLSGLRDVQRLVELLVPLSG